jgi:hypothetical protein
MEKPLGFKKDFMRLISGQLYNEKNKRRETPNRAKGARKVVRKKTKFL